MVGWKLTKQGILGVWLYKRESGSGVAGVWQGCGRGVTWSVLGAAGGLLHLMDILYASSRHCCMLHVFFTSLLLIIDLFHYMFIIKSHFQFILVHWCDGNTNCPSNFIHVFMYILQQSIVSCTSLGLPVIHKYLHFPDVTPFQYPMHVFPFNRKGERWIYTLIYLHEFLKVFPFDLALFLSSHLSGNKARHAPSQSNSTANKGYP